jgi:nucleoside phosphorylase
MTSPTSEHNRDHRTDLAPVLQEVPAPRTADSVAEIGPPTIGIVTAIPEEYAAMCALVDRPVERDVPGDPAAYVIASVPSKSEARNHRVALTLLGATATDAAADGCTHLLRSFPTVSLVLMVGIAAGIPNPRQPHRHVRLGDIVVGTRDFIDYGHIRRVAEGDQQRRQFPQPSPRFVRCADLLKAGELGGKRPWEHWIGPGRPANLVRYARPPHKTDVLRDGDGNAVAHPSRRHSEHPPNGMPKVHYGSIGSADISLRDAATRDELAARYGFLAVEMEGAGIGRSSFQNGKEWFVIRGISDYGDGHSDDAWRRYASLTAAAYVRALLAKCLPFEHTAVSG